MNRQNAPVLPEPARYRRRRLRDLAMIIPVAGLLLWLFPLVRDPANTPEPDTASGMIYVFGVWIFLIVATLFTSRSLTDEPADQSNGSDESTGEQG